MSKVRGQMSRSKVKVIFVDILTDGCAYLRISSRGGLRVSEASHIISAIRNDSVMTEKIRFGIYHVCHYNKSNDSFIVCSTKNDDFQFLVFCMVLFSELIGNINNIELGASLEQNIIGRNI
jgi:hypothetical protein